MQKSELQIAWEQAYSIENMAAHEAEGRPVEYIGSEAFGHRIYDFYRGLLVSGTDSAHNRRTGY